MRTPTLVVPPHRPDMYPEGLQPETEDKPVNRYKNKLRWQMQKHIASKSNWSNSKWQTIKNKLYYQDMTLWTYSSCKPERTLQENCFVATITCSGYQMCKWLVCIGYYWKRLLLNQLIGLILIDFNFKQVTLFNRLLLKEVNIPNLPMKGYF